MAKKNDAYRKFCQKLVAMGLSQKVLAGRMDTKESWMSEWLKHGKGILDVEQTDGLSHYLDELDKLLSTRPDRAPARGHPLERPAV